MSAPLLKFIHFSARRCKPQIFHRNFGTSIASAPSPSEARQVLPGRVAVQAFGHPSSGGPLVRPGPGLPLPSRRARRVGLAALTQASVRNSSTNSARHAPAGGAGQQDLYGEAFGETLPF